MSARKARDPGRPRRLWPSWVAGGAIVALAVTVAVVASGFDSREIPREDPSVWVARSGGQYARVNTETAEIDTVRQVESPSGVVQSAGLSLLLTQGYGRAWAIDPTSPRDIRESAAPADVEPGAEETIQVTPDQESGAVATRTPDGTRQVIAEGGRVLFHTEAGDVFIARVTAASNGGQPELGVPTRLDPLASDGESEGEEEEESGDGEPDQGYQAVAAALDANGLVALYSPLERGIRWFDSGTDAFRGGVEEVPEGVPAEGVQLAIVSGKWVLLDTASGRLWREGVDEAVELDLRGTALLQGSSVDGSGALVADEAGLWNIDRNGGAERIAQTEGVPARPQQAGVPVAAWIGSGAASLWTPDGGLIPLEIDESVEDLTDPDPVIRTNEGRALVVEARSGMMWTVPDGRLIPVEQWTLVDPPKDQQGEVVTQDVTEQEPPIAVDDAFGVRAGEPALLPVLLNDFDPNRRDVLTVVPEGLGDGLSAGFGTLTLLSDGQGLIVQPSEAAQGSASFSYRVTDGVNVSDPATVVLTVAHTDVNTGPEWCPVVGCQRNWPSPELAPGGTLVMPILEGWVDHEGDPMMLVEAEPANPEDPVRALVTADGRLAIRHTDRNAAESDVVVRVHVTDAIGVGTDRELRIRVSPGASLQAHSLAATVQVGEITILRPLERVTGGSGSFQLVDAVVQQGSVGTVVNQGAGTIEVSADVPGTAILTVTVRDTATEQEAASIIRVTAVESRGAFGVPPLRAFVRPLADTTVDVLSALPGANARALTVQSAIVRDGQLRADVIEHSRIRVSGATPDGQPGRIGSVDTVIAEGGVTAQGRLTVFQVPEAGTGGAIAVADTATVRAGSVVDIPVLDNDVSPPGERLVLHPEVGAPGIPGELAFASGSRVRYLAPSEPGTYTLSYTTYGASSPELSDVGHVRVTVLPVGPNRPPQPATVTVRVAPGETVSTVVPLSGVDPDGDRMRLVSVEAPEDPQLSASILARSSSIQVGASARAAAGTQLVSYTVRDAFDGEASGRLRIIVTEPDPGGGAPVVYSDYVRIARGATAPATVRPLDNDLDPSGGVLELVSVVPNVPGGEESPDYSALADRLDLSDMSSGIVRISGSDELGTVSFRYTARSSKSTSTADGLIVVQVSERIGQQAPTITDTVLSVRDRADFERVGVDVVTDRVRWAAGDVGALSLSLWGSAADRYSVSGSRILGGYRAEGDLVPFRLAGLDATGAEVESFGFLVVPPLDELRLSLKPGAPPISVAENASVDVRVADMIDLGPGDRIELDQAAFRTQRPQASCAATGTGTLRYTAGREAPWSDSCTIRVRLAEQTAYTVLSLPIAIVPDDPVVQLNPLTRTIAPGETQTIDLVDMLEWQGGRAGQVAALRWQVAPVTGSFDVTVTGSTMQVVAHAGAVPGSQQPVAVSVSGAGDSQAALTLRVGEAAQDAPRGATVALQCTVGANCDAALVGQPGEHDPFAGKPGGGLHVVSVDGSACAYGSLAAAGDSVRVSWADPRGPGGRCTATFTVRDAQDRTGTGTIEFDAQGVPRAPASIAAVAYTENSVTLEVQLGDASGAHPALTGIAILQDDAPSGASCAPSGGAYRCEVSGLAVGEAHTFRAVARNAVGDSDPTDNAVTTWAFKPPANPIVNSVTQVSAESSTTGTLRFTVSPGDATTGSFEIYVGGVQRAVIPNPAGGMRAIDGVTAGSAVDYRVVAVSRFEHPTGESTSGGFTDGTTTVGGLPSLGEPILSSAPGSDSVSVTVVGETNFGGPLRYGAVSSGACTASGGDADTPNFALTGTTHHNMDVTVCVRNDWGAAGPLTRTIQVGGEVPPLPGLSYAVGSAPTVNPGVAASYTSVAPPSPGLGPGESAEYRVNGGDATISGSFPALDPSAVYTIEARRVSNGVPSAWSAVSSAGAPTTAVVRLDQCVVDPDDIAALRSFVSAAAQGSATPSYDAATEILTVTWSGPFGSLDTLSETVTYCGP